MTRTGIQRQPEPGDWPVLYGLATKEDTAEAAKLYLASFPARAGKWFPERHHAECFHADLMELMRLAHGKTFFTVHSGSRFVGFLILTLPNKVLVKALFRGGFILRVVVHALTGGYGFSGRVLWRAAGSLLARPGSSVERTYFRDPHVYAIAVSTDFTGRGIGSALIERGREACAGKFSRMWLYVDHENTGARRLYARIGFHTVGSADEQDLMVWNFARLAETEGRIPV